MVASPEKALAGADQAMKILSRSGAEAESARPTEFAPAMAGHAPFFPGLSPIAGKPGQVAFDAGRLTSDGGVLVLAEIERRLGIAERLARCLEDPRAPERVQHGLAEMIRFRAPSDRGRLRGCQRLRRAARRPGLQDGGRPAARERG